MSSVSNKYIQFKAKHSSSGAVLILVLWLIMLGMILVTAIASNVRLSALTVRYHQESLADWSAILETMIKAKMELQIDRMNRTKVKEATAFKEKSKDFRFNGQPLTLHYQVPEGMRVRIYELSGKLNVSKLSDKQLTALLEQYLGEYDKRIPDLVDAWFDWIDKDELKRLNGAEKKTYEQLNLNYEPRNDTLVYLDEIRLIKGFDEVFAELDLESVFTLSGDVGSKVNPNYASKAVLMMLPGMDEKSANDIINARKTQDFKNIAELNVHLSPSIIGKVSSWFTFKKSVFYAIYVYPKEFEQQKQTQEITEKDEQQETTLYAYMEEVKVMGSLTKPSVIRVNPFAKFSIIPESDKDS